jgi:uncharacterized membrane protein YjjP (DUF1212 family)
MSDQENGVPEREIPLMGQVVQQTSRFSKEVLATMISLASAAFGVVAALAWNTAVSALVTKVAKGNARISILFVYAFFITLVGVVVIVILGRIAARLSSEPVEFKYPGVPRS